MFNIKFFMIKLFVVFLIVFVSNAFAINLFSESFKDKDALSKKFEFNGFGCRGQNLSPQLSWSGVPAGTKSFAINVYDPDAPTGSGWWHWVVFNIPANVSSLNEGASLKNMPQGAIESVTDFGSVGFGGFCPPKGDKAHRYIFTVYALKIEKLPLDVKSPAAMVGYYILSNTIEKSSIVGFAKR